MKYRVIKPVIAFGRTPKVGEIVELTTEQADALREVEAVVPYEVKVERPPKNIKKKSSASSRPARASRKKTSKKRTAKPKS